MVSFHKIEILFTIKRSVTLSNPQKNQFSVK
jgi:hypothetical protein